MSKSALSNNVIRYSFGETSLGLVLVAATELGLRSVLLGDDGRELLFDLKRRFRGAQIDADEAGLIGVVDNVAAVVDSSHTTFDMTLDLHGTQFQQRVWAALREIPPGQTMTYGEVAMLIGEPAAVRAVASACGANHLAVVIPCHRVVRRDGTLSGYRWGIERKAILLEAEKSAMARHR